MGVGLQSIFYSLRSGGHLGLLGSSRLLRGCSPLSGESLLWLLLLKSLLWLLLLKSLLLLESLLLLKTLLWLLLESLLLLLEALLLLRLTLSQELVNLVISEALALQLPDQVSLLVLTTG